MHERIGGSLALSRGHWPQWRAPQFNGILLIFMIFQGFRTGQIEFIEIMIYVEFTLAPQKKMFLRCQRKFNVNHCMFHCVRGSRSRLTDSLFIIQLILTPESFSISKTAPPGIWCVGYGRGPKWRNTLLFSDSGRALSRKNSRPLLSITANTRWKSYWRCLAWCLAWDCAEH